jgi:uncharacterized protein (TIGR02246 family)
VGVGVMSSRGLDQCCSFPFQHRGRSTPVGQLVAKLCRVALLMSLAAAMAWGSHSDVAAADADAEAALQAAATEYAEAFNRADMTALAAQWAEQAALVEDGVELVGRDEIMAAIAASRAQFPKMHMAIDVTEIRFITPNLANVSGSLRLAAMKDGPEVSAEFSSLRVLVDGQWILAESVVMSEPQASLTNVDWMEGRWEGVTASGDAIRIDVTKDLDGKAVVSRITIGPADEPLLTAIDVIHADAGSGSLRSWTFDSTGARAEGLLISDGTSFNRVVEGIPAPGSGASESGWVQVITPLDQDRLALQSIERTLDGEPLPDTDVIILKRTTP